jgi:hypothetical protein
MQTLEGNWRTQSIRTGAQSTTQEIITYDFSGGAVTRTLEWRITSLDGTLSANLLARDTATYTTDDSTVPARIDLAGLTPLAAPTNAAFLAAAAISGQTERGLTLGFSDRASFSLSEKGIFDLRSGSLRIKFGGTADYPGDLLDALELDGTLKVFGLQIP